MTEIENMRDIQEIELLLKDTKNREKALLSELEDSLSHYESVDSHLDILEALP